MSNSYKLPKGNRPTFPFIVMPLSADDGVSAAHSNAVNPELAEVGLAQGNNTAERNGNRRNSVGLRDAPPRIPLRYPPGLLETLSAQDQLRRPARLLYPSPSQTNITNAGDEIVLPTSRSRPRQTLFGLGYGLPGPNDQLEEILRNPITAAPRISSKFRRKTKVAPSQLMSGSGDRDRELHRNSVVLVGEDANLTNSPVPASGVEHANPPVLQNQMDHLFRKLRDKEGEILTLRDELALMKESMNRTNCESEASKAQCSSLRHELARVEQQLESLEERFDNQEDSQSLNLASHISTFSSASPRGMGFIKMSNNPVTSEVVHTPDFDGIIRNIRELNVLVGSNQSMELCYNSGGATFKQSEAVVITLFKNGYTLSDSPKTFRSFASAAAIQFFQDIYDGYFPSELQCKYPDGIALVVKDKRTTMFAGEGHFVGKGRKLTNDAEVLPKFYPGMKFPVLKPNQPTLAREARSSESTSSQSSVESDKYLNSYTVLPQLLLTRPSSSSQRTLYKSGMNRVITLKLKNLVSGALYKVGASISSTPDDLLLHLEKFIESGHELSESDTSGNLRKFELVNSIPFGVFTIGGATLREYGILSNTLIYFRPI